MSGGPARAMAAIPRVVLCQEAEKLRCLDAQLAVLTPFSQTLCPTCRVQVQLHILAALLIAGHGADAQDEIDEAVASLRTLVADMQQSPRLGLQ